MSDPVPAAKTTMTPQQKVLYDKWSKYYNIRGYCNNKGTRYDLLQHQSCDKSIFFDSAYSPATAIKTKASRTILRGCLAKSVSCIASTADIPFESNSFNVSGNNCRNGDNDCSKEISEPSTEGPNCIPSIKLDDAAKNENNSCSSSGWRSECSTRRMKAANSGGPKPSLQQIDTNFDMHHRNNPYHPKKFFENRNDDDESEPNRVSTKNNDTDGSFAPEIMMMIHPYCVMPTTAVNEEGNTSSGNGGITQSINNDLIQFVLMRHSLQSTIDNSRHRNGDTATPTTGTSKPFSQEYQRKQMESPQKDTDVSVTTATTTTQEDKVSQSPSSAFLSQANTRYSDSRSINSEMNTNDLIQSVLEKHRLKFDVGAQRQDKDCIPKKQRLMPHALLNKISQVNVGIDDAITIKPKPRKTICHSLNADSKKSPDAGAAPKATTKNNYSDIPQNNIPPVDHSKPGNLGTNVVDIDDDHSCVDDNHTNTTLNDKRAPHRGKNYRSIPAPPTSSKRKRKVAAKCVYVNVNRTSDCRRNHTLTGTAIDAATQKWVHNELPDKLHRSKRPKAKVENGKSHPSKNLQTTVKGDDDNTKSGNRSPEEKYIAEAVLMLNQTKNGLCPANKDNFKLQNEILLHRSEYHPSENSTISQLSTNDLYQLNREQVNRNFLQQQLQHQPLKYSSTPMLATQGQLNPQVRTLTSNNNNDVPAPFGIAQHQRLQQSFATTVPTMFKTVPFLNNTGPPGRNLTRVPLGAEFNQGTSMVFHGVISSYPIQQVGPLPPSPQPRSMMPPPSTHPDHSVSKRGMHPPSYDGTRDIDEQQRQQQRRKLEYSCKTTSSTRPIDPVKSPSSNYGETDVGKLQQVNETWKKRYLALLRDEEEQEINSGQL